MSRQLNRAGKSDADILFSSMPGSKCGPDKVSGRRKLVRGLNFCFPSLLLPILGGLALFIPALDYTCFQERMHLCCSLLSNYDLTIAFIKHLTCLFSY